MKIAYLQAGGDTYFHDAPFQSGVNRYNEPTIELQRYFEEHGDELHTSDCYANARDIDFAIFTDVSMISRKTFRSFHTVASYFFHRLWRIDEYARVINAVPLSHRLLVIAEPFVVNPLSHQQKYYKDFKRVLTWNDDLVDNSHVLKSCYPQPLPEKDYHRFSFARKKDYVLISANKSSRYAGELYSKRRDVIQYFEHVGGRYDFDLYGYGWSSELSNYKGSVEDKLATMARYKFAFCFENMTGVRGYITEKIFDCFFAGTVPIYWGADNISDYVPKAAFIDWRDYNNIEEVLKYTENMMETDYNTYVAAAQEFLKSDAFARTFSTEAYVQRIAEQVYI